LAPKTIAQLEYNTVTARVEKKYMGEPNRWSKGLPATSLSDLRTGQRVSEELGGDLDAVLMEADRTEPGGPLQSRGLTMPADGLACADDMCCANPAIQTIKESDTEIEHAPTTKQDAAERFPTPYHNSTHELQTDIYLRKPTGECVPGHEVQWELNPYAKICGDTSGLMGIVPDHHHIYMPAPQRKPCAPLYEPTSARSFTKLPQKES